MLQRIWFCRPRKPTPSALCNLRNAVLLVFAITVFWIFLAAHTGVNRTWITQTTSPNLGAEINSNPSTTSTTTTTVVRNASLVTASTAVRPTTSNLTRRRYLSQSPPMPGIGQGNLMFMYASLLGIAASNRMTPVYPKDGSLRKIFHISAAVSLLPTDSNSMVESKACAYDAQFESLSKRQDNVTAVGYLQSWKYFGAISERIRREFTFVDRLKDDANQFLRNISTPPTTTKTVLYVGAHIRRRDMLASFNVERGYTVATKEYLVGAVRYFRSQFPSQLLVFVVCSDDVDWAKKKFPPADNSSVVVFSENRNAEQDMALLAACNHSIMTVGTYGWWSAYLAGGRTVYYQNFPKPGSNIASIFDKNDYYPPEWIGLLL